ncbi:hypothetical protein HYH03_007946 [Edaphochlamys debaryana]|uniref:Uncharacterized protein n=1 Tax=Edaphochlamys debaryana TaxID=47281 RepID=A0A836BYW3_9CHLO|nr:hypothetical protein HYH03_007946 [Edaphochlamys debaryana]|eukprot:KAG2494020.1 hypothetical protein HYH03_007946 [Edaphochlamys debaryana]
MAAVRCFVAFAVVVALALCGLPQPTTAATPSPRPSPKPFPSPSPRPSPRPSPKASPSPSPRPSPKPTPSPSPRPSPSRNATCDVCVWFTATPRSANSTTIKQPYSLNATTCRAFTKVIQQTISTAAATVNATISKAFNTTSCEPLVLKVCGQFRTQADSARLQPWLDESGLSYMYENLTNSKGNPCQMPSMDYKFALTVFNPLSPDSSCLSGLTEVDCGQGSRMPAPPQSRPSPKASPSPSPRPSPKTSPRPSPRPSPKASPSPSPRPSPRRPPLQPPPSAKATACDVCITLNVLESPSGADQPYLLDEMYCMLFEEAVIEEVGVPASENLSRGLRLASCSPRAARVCGQVASEADAEAVSDWLHDALKNVYGAVVDENSCAMVNHVALVVEGATPDSQSCLAGMVYHNC